jgi:GNAT superfamily N-acetyltransferase
MSVAIRYATTSDDVALARDLFVEYAEWLDYDLCFQGFEQELATLPGAYAPPRGRLLVVGEDGGAFGCIALRPLAREKMASGSLSPACDAKVNLTPFSDVGEVKRLFVRDAQRGGGWGRRLARAIVEEARTIGYRELKLDTLEPMRAAQSLYASLGFRRCAPYYHNPLPGVIYMSLPLDTAD